VARGVLCGGSMEASLYLIERLRPQVFGIMLDD